MLCQILLFSLSLLSLPPFPSSSSPFLLLTPSSLSPSLSFLLVFVSSFVHFSLSFPPSPSPSTHFHPSLPPPSSLLPTPRERLLLVNPASSTITKQLVALVVGEFLRTNSIIKSLRMYTIFMLDTVIISDLVSICCVNLRSPIRS